MFPMSTGSTATQSLKNSHPKTCSLSKFVLISFFFGLPLPHPTYALDSRHSSSLSLGSHPTFRIHKEQMTLFFPCTIPPPPPPPSFHPTLLSHRNSQGPPLPILPFFAKSPSYACPLPFRLSTQLLMDSIRATSAAPFIPSYTQIRNAFAPSLYLLVPPFLSLTGNPSFPPPPLLPHSSQSA